MTDFRETPAETLARIAFDMRKSKAFPDCYNCEGNGKFSVDKGDHFDIIDCPICKGTGKKDAGQGQLF